MKKKTYNEEKFLKKLKRDAVFSGITSIIIGVMTIAVFLVFAIDSRELAFMIFGLVLGSVFIASGIYFFRRPGIIEKRNRELDNPESIIYKKKGLIMEATVFNPVQQHLLRMFAYDGDENRLAEIKTVLADYLSNKIDKKIDTLWDTGILDQKKLDEIRGKDLRTYLK